MSAAWFPGSGAEYRVYGDLQARETASLISVLVAKQLPLRFVEQTASLRLPLEARSGCEEGPYLRTPEGFVLGGLGAILDWLEAMHPLPALVPRTPVRFVAAALLELWTTRWLPLFADRSWRDLEAIGRHLDRSTCLLGESPQRVDWRLAAWVESDLMGRPAAAAQLTKSAPALTRFGDRLLATETRPEPDDVLPISLLDVLQRLGGDYQSFLAANREALGKGEERVLLDLGLGPRALPVRPGDEAERLRIATQLSDRSAAEQTAVRRTLQPLGLGPLLSWGPVSGDLSWNAARAADQLDPSDPRSLEFR